LNENNNFNYFGNVEIGKTISSTFLSQNYSAIVYAYGAESKFKTNKWNT
jgi:NADPH-dependent glutamate synthase beta subunit-like oxidoreductase